MRMRALYFSLPLSLLLFVIGCLSGYIDISASAALTGGRFMSATEARQVFGDTIHFQYWNGTDYVDGTLTYNRTCTLSSCDSTSGASDYINDHPTCLFYSGWAHGYRNSDSQITFDINPTYSIFDTSQLHTIIALSSSSNVASSFQSPTWDWLWGGSSVHLENSDFNSSGFHARVYMDTGHYCTYVPCDFSSQSLTSGYSTRATFCGNTSSNSQFGLYIGLPYIDTDATGSNGTFTTSAGSGGGSTEINVDVNVDMSETNGILGTISDILSGIVDGIQGLFVPDTSWMNAWYESVEDTLDDVFGASSAASAMVEQAFTTLIQGTAVNSIYFPAIEIPNLSGGVVTLYAGGNVPLLPQNTNFTVSSGFLGSASLYDYMKYLIDIVATMAVINMVRTKLHAILVGEVVATNDGGDDE